MSTREDGWDGEASSKEDGWTEKCLVGRTGGRGSV